MTSDERGWSYAPIWEMGVSMALYGDATTPRVFGLTKIEHSLLLIICLWGNRGNVIVKVIICLWRSRGNVIVKVIICL